MTSDELKALPKGRFIVMKTGCHPMKTRLRLFLDWGITFGEAYAVPERAAREMKYANHEELQGNITRQQNVFELAAPDEEQSEVPSGGAPEQAAVQESGEDEAPDMTVQETDFGPRPLRTNVEG